MASHKLYHLFLPVQKPGEDLAEQLEVWKTPVAAFEALAQHYEAAATECRRVAAAVSQAPEIEVRGDAHGIEVVGLDHPPLEALVEKGLLVEEIESGVCAT